jgi:hypothetical protein
MRVTTQTVKFATETAQSFQILEYQVFQIVVSKFTEKLIVSLWCLSTIKLELFLISGQLYFLFPGCEKARKLSQKQRSATSAG